MKLFIATLLTLTAFSALARHSATTTIWTTDDLTGVQSQIAEKNIMQTFVTYDSYGLSLCFKGESSELQPLIERATKNKGQNDSPIEVKKIEGEVTKNGNKKTEYFFTLTDESAIVGISLTECE